MARSRRKKPAAGDVWLLKETGRRKGARSRADEADESEWLAIPDDSSGGSGRGRNGAPGADAKPGGRKARRKPAVPSVGSAREKRLQAKLRRAKETIAAQQEEIEDLRRRLNELGDKEPKPRARAKAPKPRAKKAAPKRSKPRAGAKSDINAVTFEQLCDLGLSVTQSARLIAHREMREGFTSLDELDRLSGFPRETLAELKAQMRVNPR